MQIKIERPPIYEEAHARFDIEDNDTIYAWGDTLYNHGNIHIDPPLLAHESTHSRQQEKVGGPAAWWDRYFKDCAFREWQEREAYAEQYLSFCFHVKDRNRQTKYLYSLASSFASPLYKLQITSTEARHAIINEAAKVISCKKNTTKDS